MSAGLGPQVEGTPPALECVDEVSACGLNKVLCEDFEGVPLDILWDMYLLVPRS